MKTASFTSGEHLLGAIAICRWLPEGVRADMPRYPALAPDPGLPGLLSFPARLRALDARREWEALHGLVPGHEPVLLCWEVDPVGCHRRMVARWFSDALAEDVPEFRVWGL